MPQSLKGKRALIVMAKRPFPGRTKTRLVPPLTDVQAAQLYEGLLRDALAQARSVPQVTAFVAYSPPNQQTEAYFRQMAAGFELLAQQGDTLGERLDVVLSQVLALGFEQVVAMNSDSPTLPVRLLEEAFLALDDPATDIVLGPCEDGGYYLIGWKQRHPRLVREVEMSTNQVLADTLRLAKEEQLQADLLAPWFDIDDLSDLKRIEELNSDGADAFHTRHFLSTLLARNT